jgi:RNA polymerase sigma-70 factor (ECF subfamily)
LSTDGPPRILGYGGRAALSSWVSVAAQRLALGLLRSEGARRRVADRAGDEPGEADLDPELAYLKARYRDDFKAALTTALAGLPERQRTVVRLHTVGGLTLARIAALLSVDESTVSGWLARARETILAETERELGRRLGMNISEVPSLARLVTSQLDVSVARLLTDEEASG